MSFNIESFEQKFNNVSNLRKKIYEIKSIDSFIAFRDELNAHLLVLESDLRGFNFILKSTDELNKDLRKYNESLDTKIQQLNEKNDNIQDYILELKKENNDLTNHINLLNSEMMSKIAHIEEMRERINTLDSKSLKCDINIKKLNNEKKLLQDRIEKIQQINTLKKLQTDSNIQTEDNYNYCAAEPEIDNYMIKSNSGTSTFYDKATRIYKLILKVFASDELTNYLRNLFGKDFHSKLTTREIDENFINQIEEEIQQFESKLRNKSTGITRKSTNASNSPFRKPFINYTKIYSNYFDPSLQRGGKSEITSPNRKEIPQKKINLNKPGGHRLITDLDKTYQYREFPSGWLSTKQYFKTSQSFYK